MTDTTDRTLEVAATISSWIEEDGARVAVIGAVAMACHGYIRATRDLDLGTELDPFVQMRDLASRCEAEGWTAELRLPDAEDPLGGVLDVTGPGFDLVQIVNFHNPLRDVPNPGALALDGAIRFPTLPGLRVARVEELVLLKLYAGGRKSELDVLELLEAQPELDLDSLRRNAARFGLEAALDRVLEA